MAETEGGSPDGSHRAEPGLSGPSAREALREYWLQCQAELLRIPPESLGNPTVRHYVSVVEDLNGFWSTFHHFEPEAEDFLIGRYYCVFSLLQAADLFLHEGLHRRYRDSDGITGALDAAAGAFGWTVRSIDAEAADVAIPAPTGLWRDDPTRPWRPRTPPAGEDALPKPLSEDRLRGEAERVGVPPALLEVDPTLRQLLAYLITARALHAEIGETGLPEAPGLTPSAQERLERVRPLAQLVVAVLEDEFQPGHLTSERFAATLAPVLTGYNLRIEREGGGAGSIRST